MKIAYNLDYYINYFLSRKKIVETEIHAGVASDVHKSSLW